MLTGSALTWTYICAGIGLFIVANLIYAIWRGRNQVAAGKTWARAPGEIIASEVVAAGSHTSDEDSDCTPSVRYRYTVAGKIFESDRIQFGGQPDTTRLMAEQIVAKFPAGRHVDVLYDPRRPKNAVLESKSAISPALYVMLVVFSSVTVFLVAHSIAGKVLYTESGVPMVAFLGPFAAIGLAIVCLHAYFDIRRKEKASAHWPTANGTITTSDVAEEISTDKDDREVVKYRADIRYSYRVAGHDYSSSTRKWGWTEIYPDAEGPAAIVAKYPKGGNVPVFYDLAEPSNAVLEPSSRVGNAAPLFGAFLFALPGVIFLWVFVTL
jgi:hypothetical protein